MIERSRLVRLHVKNIGCIGNEGLTVELDDIVCLVGANNSGKTTVLRAYEVAIENAELKLDDLNIGANGNPASVELWVHIPKSAANVDEKWKEAKDGFLLVRSKWEWPANGGKPIRTTFDPTTQDYAENGKASGLDTVFNSRLPKPFRIGSLDNPLEEHKKLLALVLEPVVNRYKLLMQDQSSDLRKKVEELRFEAEKPVEEFKDHLERIQTQVNSSYRQVFNAAEIKLTVSLGEIDFDPLKSLTTASRVDIDEKHGRTKWNQQGTGSQRALFWSMLQVRSELNRLSEQKKQLEKNNADLVKLEQKSNKSNADERKITNLKKKIAEEESVSDSFLPGYMLLIDEPETALHPSAVRAAKEHLYALASESGWQVMLSTHHPAFIDPLKNHTTIVRLHRLESHLPPNIYCSEKINFEGDELENLKTLLAFDANVAEMFFGNNILLVEGDTEFATFNEIMTTHHDKYPLDSRPLIIRTRGKATISTLIKMLTHFKIDFSVLHDIDSPKTSDGEKKNSAYSENKKITDAVASARAKGLRVRHRCSCPNFEQHNGMNLPSKDKPYASWKMVRNNDDIRFRVKALFDNFFIDIKQEDQDPNDGKFFETTLKDWIQKNNITDKAFNFE